MRTNVFFIFTRNTPVVFSSIFYCRWIALNFNPSFCSLNGEGWSFSAYDSVCSSVCLSTCPFVYLSVFSPFSHALNRPSLQLSMCNCIKYESVSETCRYRAVTVQSYSLKTSTTSFYKTYPHVLQSFALNERHLAWMPFNLRLADVSIWAFFTPLRFAFFSFLCFPFGQRPQREP